MVVIVEPVRVSCDLPHIPIEKGSKVDGTMRKPVYLQEGSPQLSSAELYFVQVDVLEYYPGETVVVRSATEAHMLPAVLRVRVFVQREWSKAPISLSRRNIMLRDKFSCQCASCTPPLGPEGDSHRSVYQHHVAVIYLKRNPTHCFALNCNPWVHPPPFAQRWHQGRCCSEP